MLLRLQQDGIRDLSLGNLPADSPSVAALQSAASGRGFHIYARPAYDCARVILGSPAQRSGIEGQAGQEENIPPEYPCSVAGRPRAGGPLNPVGGSRTRAARIHHCSRGALPGDWPHKQSGPCEPTTLFARAGPRCSASRGNLALARFMMGCWQSIAWNYGFRFGRSWFWYQPTFESRLEVRSPGRLLLANMLMEVCDDPAVEVFDLGLGAEGYKERVANSSRSTLHVTISRSPIGTVRATGPVSACGARQAVSAARGFLSSHSAWPDEICAAKATGRPCRICGLSLDSRRSPHRCSG